MPIDLTPFTVSQVRVAPINAVTTLPPFISGSYTASEDRDYLLIVENTGDLDMATFSFLRNDFSYDDRDQTWKAEGPVDSSGNLVTSTSPLEDGLAVEWFKTRNDDDPDVSIAVPISGQVLLSNNTDPVPIINPPILSRSSGLVLRRNDALLTEDEDYVLSIAQGFIQFADRITAEVLTAAAPPETKFLQTAIPSVFPDLMILREDAVPKTNGTDFTVNEAGLVTLIQPILDEDISSETPFLNEEVFPYDPLIEATLNGIDLTIGVEFTIQSEAGWFNTLEPLFEGDILLATYSGASGDVVDERLVDNPARVDTVAGPFVFAVDSELNFKLQTDSFSVQIPAGTVSASDLVDLINDEVGSVVAEEITGSKVRIESTDTNGSTSTLEILAGSANAVLGLTTGVVLGGVALGGEATFELDDPPITLNFFVSPEGQNFIDFPNVDVTSNYSSGTIFSIDKDFYVSSNAPDFDGSRTRIFTDLPLRREYKNPFLNFITGPVVFLPELNSFRNIPINASQIFFDGIDLTGRYPADSLIRVGGVIFFIAGSVFQDDATIVNLRVKTTEPIANTESMFFTDVIVVFPGGTRLQLQFEPVLIFPFELRKNGTPLIINVDFIVDTSGLIILVDPIQTGDVFEADYTGLRELPVGTFVDTDYTTPSSTPAKSKIEADYLFENADVFYFRVISEQTFFDEISPQIKSDLLRAINPTAGGPQQFTAPPSGNQTKGGETPAWTLRDFEIRDQIFKKQFDFYADRAEFFLDEKEILSGFIAGANDGRIVESDIEAAAVLGDSRLFPEGFTGLTPFEVNYLKGLALNDDGSSTGGSTTDNLTAEVAAEETAVTTMDSDITTLLLETAFTATGSAAPTFTFVTGTDDVLSYTRDSVPHLVTFVPVPFVVLVPGTPFLITASDVMTQINTVDPGAITGTGPLTMVFTLNLTIGGPARPVIGFNTGSDRTSTAAGLAFAASQTATLTALAAEETLLDREIVALDGVLEETTEPAETEATSRRAEVVAFRSATITFQVDVAAPNVEVDLDLTTLKGKIPARKVLIDAEQIDQAVRLVEVDATLGEDEENLLPLTFGWITLRVSKKNGSLTSVNRQESAGVESEAEAEALGPVVDIL